MQTNVLVDSSFFIQNLRKRINPFQELADSDERWEFFTVGVVILEVSRGAKTEAAMRGYRHNFAVLPCIPTTPRIWDLAADLAWQMDRAGFTMQVTDLLIAASALSVDAALLTFDADFLRVPGLTVLHHL